MLFRYTKDFSLLIFVGLLGLLSACFQQRAVHRFAPHWKHLPLQTPSSYGHPGGVEMLLELKFGKRDPINLRLIAEISPNSMNVAALTIYQVRAFSIAYDGQTLDFENITGKPVWFRPQWLLADLQLLLWPQVAAEGDWRVETDGQQRRVYFRDKLFTSVFFGKNMGETGTIELVNHRHRYAMTARILDSWAL